MRQRLVCAIGFLAAAFVASAALAHGGEIHGVPAVAGTIVATSPDSITIDTRKGRREVTLTKDTHVMVGEQVGGREALRPGSSAEVWGTRLPGGGTVAKEVRVREPAGAQVSEPAPR